MKNLLLLLCLGIFAGCQDDKINEPLVCEWNGSFDDFPFMETMKESMTNCICVQSIFQATYKDQTVFYQAITDPRCDSIFAPTLYNCDGDVVRVFTATEYNEFFIVVTEREIIYSCTP
jgi:hypothetical protein